ncbi:hypothetical protein AMAG_17951 [Allomyces macrogynus ATCC 38327]|uniref:Uncharacterized protein n=1 Tax=Allomyces macrogynus (strain ATCC 38327) TaxID=578462 RepID=A0A0L0S2P4_ALLM3|nr:hypothetical protein AMAG_17951 [Allomyces macrogynus ATCC 38327]|eukprot:KNE56671.1 hypothetical protein AMAG_17951 [Allomyces macrogynus ATCC 38327]
MASVADSAYHYELLDDDMFSGEGFSVSEDVAIEGDDMRDDGMRFSVSEDTAYDDNAWEDE